ncbi:tannase/feruloyl esterase family alpha/beta hydrolase [Micromonospora sp. DT81.3]|uniref:tannase/feruloyl esterase family alpha/beta hydrolase n=1 Tax=Micromonospora sp. DT81.3 TaxID=3416523 RepID=UPI003CF0633A
MNRIRRLAATVAVGAVTIASLVAGGGAAAAAPTRWGPPELGPRVCSVLKYIKIPQQLIGLPTGGAAVESATWNAGGYCSVVGWIWPKNAGAPGMQFQVNLPKDWNGRALQFGGGGYDGSLVTGLGQYSAQPVGEPAPIDQGYVTLGSDGGHQGGPGFDGTFGLNDEALLNYGQQSVKKAHDAAMVLIAAAYWKKPSYFYFAGGSQGGHEALDAAARYPKDYDGVIANYPAYNVTMMHEGAVNFRDALYGNGGAGWLSPAKTKLITDTVYATCDGLDGADDQVISNVSGCNDAFDVTVLRCPSGADEGDSCLSDAQLASAVKIATDYDLGFEIAGNSVFAKSALFEGALYQGFAGFGTDPVPSNPIDGSEALQYIILDQTSKYIVTRDPSLDTMAFDPADWADRIQEVGKIMDVTDVSLEPFRARGGKILLTHGTADDFITPHNTIQYYERQVAAFGEEKLDSFLRFYEVPGWGHGQGPFNAKYDGLGTLTAWVEDDVAPTGLVAFDANEGANRSRPMCEYPSWPQYTGSGSIADAASFQCVTG